MEFVSIECMLYIPSGLLSTPEPRSRGHGVFAVKVRVSTLEQGKTCPGKAALPISLHIIIIWF